MAAPKYIKAKAEQLERALDAVSRLSAELEDWYAGKTDDYAAQDFFHDQALDIPYEFNLASVLEALDKAADGKAQHRGSY